MKSKIILALAIIMGIATTVLFYRYMQQFDTKQAVNENTQEVVVAAEAIKRNQRITGDMLELKSLPIGGLHPQTVRSIEEVTGLYATADIAKGEAVLKHRTMSEAEEELFVSRKVRDGYRAVAVGADFVRSVSNLIEPEDWVDVVYTETIDNGSGEQTVSRMLLENVRVLAVGRRMIESSTKEDYVEYSSVTLELLSPDAVKLIQASERGTLHFILRSRIIPADKERSS